MIGSRCGAHEFSEQPRTDAAGPMVGDDGDRQLWHRLARRVPDQNAFLKAAPGGPEPPAVVPGDDAAVRGASPIVEPSFRMRQVWRRIG